MKKLELKVIYREMDKDEELDGSAYDGHISYNDDIQDAHYTRRLTEDEAKKIVESANLYGLPFLQLRILDEKE